MLVQVNRRLKRNKAFDQGRVQGRIVAALDGIEVLSSYSRCCESCLERRVPSLGQDGKSGEHIQYYHRAVGCQIVSAPVKPLLAVEWLEEETSPTKFWFANLSSNNSLLRRYAWLRSPGGSSRLPAAQG
jgi:hypothetical protein